MTTWQLTPLAPLYLLAVVIAFSLSYASWKMRPVRGAAYFSLLTLATGIWSLGYLLGFFNSDPVWKLVMLRIEYIGVISTTFIWVLFCLLYGNYDHFINRRSITLLAIIPLLTLVQILFVTQHQFFYLSYEFALRDGLVQSMKQYGPGFYLWMVYGYLVVLVGTLILVSGTLRMPSRYRGQSVLILAALATIFLSNLLVVTNNNPISPHDLTPLSFVVAGILFAVTMRRFRFLDITPVAYNQVFAGVDNGVIILDERAYILDMNPCAEEIFLTRRHEALGKPIFDVLLEYRDLIDQFWNVQETRTEIELGKKCFEFQVTPFRSNTGGHMGRIILLYDITERKLMEDRQVELIAQLQEAVDRIQTLSGFLPICAGCKKIRDDNGSWHPVDVYIQEHSKAEFSHEICPACMTSLYPVMSGTPQRDN